MEKIDNQSKDASSLSNRAFKEIEGAILDGTFAPGTNLIEMKLSSDLGVSRTPVREALRLLELEGLVQTVPNKGAVVIGISEKDIDDIYTIRMHIEGLAAGWAAKNITSDELEALKSVVDLQEFYASKGDSQHVWKLDDDFHRIIYESCRSKPLKNMLSSFHHYISKARETSMKSEGRSVLAVIEHKSILNAIAAGDSENAERLSAEHIKMARDNFFRNEPHES